MSARKCWVTLMTGKSYLPGVICLAKSLMRVKTKFPLLVLVPNLENEETDLSRNDYDELIRLGSYYYFRFIDIKEINRVHWKPNKYICDRFKEVSTKIRVWDIEGYDLVGFLDADMCVIRNMDELLELELDKNTIAACHACTCNPLKIPLYPKSWTPDSCAYTKGPIYPESNNVPPITNSESYFNSGIMILRPSKSKFNEIFNLLTNHKNPDKLPFPDQDLLNEVYKGNWIGLPYIYNALKTLRNCHSSIWSDKCVKNVHYILSDKPWNEDIVKMRSMTADEMVYDWILKNWWWKVYNDEEWEDGDFEDIVA
ncbi:glycosyltransferase family 8 protein [Gigaspora margarita]|uniref:Glycosyltransferase family 8 protein n=1 Tax=Gigaspora margarita TaxID=4874 RepID=A0A8H3X6M0_GIGMA|nr:glycosyltransferase family 8 protein [Gigaspora margarita]